jgi:TonB family protein
MLLRIMTNGSLMLALLTGLSLSQSGSTKPTTYTLEPTKVSNAIYSSNARKHRIQGRVVAMMLVSETGDVENVEVFKADAILSQAVQEVIRDWKFKPVTKDGSAVPVIAKATFNFVLGNEGQQVAPEIAPATDFPQHIRVSEGVMQGLVLSKVSPEYPPPAKANHVKGAVTLSMVIRKDGTVTDVEVESGPAELTAAAVDALRQWRYRPYQFMGRPVEIQTMAQFNFR